MYCIILRTIIAVDDKIDYVPLLEYFNYIKEKKNNICVII